MQLRVPVLRLQEIGVATIPAAEGTGPGARCKVKVKDEAGIGVPSVATRKVAEVQATGRMRADTAASPARMAAPFKVPLALVLVALTDHSVT